ncbi:MAG: hypothetical protein HZB19_12270 [Chloroflexi bacterium]|nr:hypothetical protein [Chloroflexota bacterium]
MKTFYATLANSLAAFLTNNFVWFAVTFWVFLETRSVIATSILHRCRADRAHCHTAGDEVQCVSRIVG